MLLPQLLCHTPLTPCGIGSGPLSQRAQAPESCRVPCKGSMARPHRRLSLALPVACLALHGTCSSLQHPLPPHLSSLRSQLRLGLVQRPPHRPGLGPHFCASRPPTPWAVPGPIILAWGAMHLCHSCTHQAVPPLAPSCPAPCLPLQKAKGEGPGGGFGLAWGSSYRKGQS